MCDGYEQNCKCAHKITKKEIIHDIQYQIRTFQNDYTTSEQLFHEFTTGIQNN